MPKFIVDLWLDGYNSEEEMTKACEEFIKDQLDFSASSVSVERLPKDSMIISPDDKFFMVRQPESQT